MISVLIANRRVSPPSYYAHTSDGRPIFRRKKRATLLRPELAQTIRRQLVALLNAEDDDIELLAPAARAKRRVRVSPS